MTCIWDLHKNKTSSEGWFLLHSASPSPRTCFIIFHIFFSFPVCVRFMEFRRFRYDFVNTVVAEQRTGCGCGFETDYLGRAVLNDPVFQPLLVYEYGTMVET